MLIKINGEEMNVAEGSTIQDVIDESNAPYTPGSIICLIKGKKNLKRMSANLKLKQRKDQLFWNFLILKKHSL